MTLVKLRLCRAAARRYSTVMALTLAFVAAGGFLFVGSSAFTRNTNGVSRGDFAIASQMGLHLLSPGLTNWAANNYFTKTNQSAHRLVSHIPDGQNTWRMPSSSEEIPW